MPSYHSVTSPYTLKVIPFLFAAFVLLALQIIPMSNVAYAQSDWFRLQNRNWGLCLNLQNATANGVTTNAWKCQPHADQEWRMIPAGGEWFRLQNRNWDKCLNLQQATENGKQTNAWKCVPHPDQEWRIVHAEDGWFRLQNRKWDKCLNLQNATQNGIENNSWKCVPHPDQEWQFLVTNTDNNENWMANAFRSSGRRLTLSEILIPGSHDAGSYRFAIPGFQTQDHLISQQLVHGARYLDLRVLHNGSEFVIHHSGLAFDSMKEVLAQVKRFADKHPQEIIILHFQDVRVTNYVDAFKSEIKTSLGSRILPIDEHTSTIHDIWKTGKNLILFLPGGFSDNTFFNTNDQINNMDSYAESIWVEDVKKKNKEVLETEGFPRTNLLVSQFIVTPADAKKPAMKLSRQWVKDMWANRPDPLCPNIVMVDWYTSESAYTLVDLAKNLGLDANHNCR